MPIASSALGFPLIPTHDNTDDDTAPFLADIVQGVRIIPQRFITWFDSLNQRFIVSYHDIPFFANNAVGFSRAIPFQIILDGRNSTITFFSI
ncbi:MAG: hypothetical protein R3B93_03810 [Bacteroidia bacterium]